MGFITAGYDGTVDETQFAEILHRYSVVGPDDFKATTQAGDRIVAISDGTALGPGTRDVATAIPNIQFAVASGTRWDLVVLRRDWQPPGGSSSITIIQGGSTKGYPGIGAAATNWNRRPGIMDDQPLYLQEINGTLLGQRVDLRAWAAHGGMSAKDDLVRTYLDRVGTEVNINGVLWRSQVGANGIQEWVKAAEVGKIPMLAAGSPLSGIVGAGQNFLIQAGSAVGTTDPDGFGRLTFPEAFPNGLLTALLFNGDGWASGAGATIAAAGSATANGTPGFWGQSGYGSKTDLVIEVRNADGTRAPGRAYRINWIAIGW